MSMVYIIKFKFNSRFLTINLYFGTKSCKLSCYASAKFEVERSYDQKEIQLNENTCIHYLALGHTKGVYQ